MIIRICYKVYFTSLLLTSALTEEKQIRLLLSFFLVQCCPYNEKKEWCSTSYYISFQGDKIGVPSLVHILTSALSFIFIKTDQSLIIAKKKKNSFEMDR